jgi:asparagine synthase (glutamine-hydrolysing)
MTSQYVKMALSGDGGDENFAGYNSYEYVASQLAGTPVAAGDRKRRWFRTLAGRYYRKLSDRAAHRGEIDRAYALHCVTAHHFHPQERRDLFKAEYRDAVREVQPERRALLDMDDAPIVSRLQRLDLLAYLPYDILTKVDVASMANSLEVRVPLLDHKLVEMAATVPADLKLRPEVADGTKRYDKKHLLKRVAKRRYRPELIDRPKMGFGVPIGAWMAGKLRQPVERRLVDSHWLALLFDMSRVSTLWRRHVQQGDCTPKIWNLLFLEEWMRTHPEALPADSSSAGTRLAQRSEVSPATV